LTEESNTGIIVGVFVSKVLRKTRGIAYNREVVKISEDGLDLIKHFEGLELTAYKDPVGIWTIGYGHIKLAKEGMVITEKEAEAMLRHEMEEYEGYINRQKLTLKQHEFDALVSWVYNLGPANLITSTMLKRLHSNDYWDVPFQMQRWNKAGGNVLRGLVKRRKAESLLFEGEDWSDYEHLID